MTDVWPVGLPQYVQVDGYSEAVGDGVIETQPDIGPTITRMRTTAAARPLSISYELSRAQLAILRTFYETTLLFGSLPFTFPATSQDGTLLVKFQKGGGPKWSGLGGRYFRVTMTLWILP